jgi:hypothetical protein
LFLDDEKPQVARQLYQTALNRAIVEGRLQDALMEINQDSPARILTGKSQGINGVSSSDYTAKVVILAVAVLVVLMVAIFIARKRGGKPVLDELQPVSSFPFGKEFEPGSAATKELDSAERQTTDEEAGAVQSGEAILGAAKASYRQSSSEEDWSREDSVEVYIEGRGQASSTSSAEQSGWSSSNYTSSIDDSGGEYTEDKLDPTTFGAIMFVPHTRSTVMDNAIVAGDQAAVGVAAAPLAANASGSISSNHSSIKTDDSSLKVQVDEQKAAELHRLIEAGDWEGIIRAAQTFSSDDKSFAGSIVSHQDSQGSASGTVEVEEQKAADLHRLIQVGDWEGAIRPASTFSSDDKSFDGSTISHQSSQGSASNAVQEEETKAAELHRLIQVGDWEGIMRAASTISSDDKSFDGSILSHQNSQGSASGAVLLDEPKPAKLRRLIQVGDWEGVRRSAKTFSNEEKSVIGSTLSHQNWQGSASGTVLVDEPKAAELHRLIQVGDWEGVRRAATTFSSDDKSFDGSRSSHQDSQGSTNSISIEGSATSATRSATSTGTSMNLDPAELRRQVEELLQQVAPEYIDKVDETLLRFKGREDELLKTLQTMQGRQMSTSLELQPKSERTES